ncbi:PRD domain-containing protein [Lactobacillus sp. ESL0236]|uniref:BglG family transcription antiterminator n=1 Tax=unclassified Lactobacillus TaxID=2620435 RepID=UPI000EFD12CF|nr:MULTISPECIES: PRD domain-containing protein [unclassified Lactobacillus]RMC39179.1 PRD domain-containing protein [Lactobacillus sp. ESL0237]RMC43462.1 PRD domain-containing protein [Lactobacillus sp. ESL0234]RMC44375.1 PRD domain-containing protein [Lactobacillus sp. ESL0236]
MQKEISQQIIDYLKVHNRFITSDELSSGLSVSKKTIARHINSLNEKFPKPIIISQRGRGYELNYSNYLDYANQNFHHDSSTHLRQENMLTKLLFASPNEVKIYDLVNSLYVSESVLWNDEKQISKKIQKWNLKLKRKQRSIQIVGNEKDIRNALIELVLHINNLTDIETLRKNTSRPYQKDFNFALSQVEMALRVLNGSLPYPYNINFFAHIYILLTRASKYKSVDKSIISENNLQEEIKNNPEIFSICKTIIDNIKKYLGVTGTDLDSEVYYLFKYLLTSRFNSFDGIVLDDCDLAEELTDFFIQEVSQNLNCSFELSIKDEIKDHVLAMISRLKMKVLLPNALINDIKLEYPKVFAATKMAAIKVSRKFVLPKISDDEIGFICLYFAKYYEEKNKSNTKIKTYVICTTGIGTSGIISTKIKNSIPDIEIIGLASNFDVKTILKKQPTVDLLISTVPINYHGEIPIELVSAFFTEKDEQKVKNVVRKIQSKKRSI